MEGDIDNIVKPILDGMINVAYLDDDVVERVLVQKFEPGIERSFLDVTESLAAALDVDAPVVYIRVDDDLSWRTL
jgi:crossover junction endodeoxyribonuclease RusA